MSLTTRINRPCVLLLRSETGELDDYGNEIPDEIQVDAVCEIQQRSRDEQDDQGDLSDTVWDLFLLPAEDLRSGDGVFIEDLGEFEVVGKPEQMRNPRTQRLGQVEATLEQTAGPEDAS